MNGQLQTELDNKSYLENDARGLQSELNSLRAMDKTYAKLERAKRRVEDEFNTYKVSPGTNAAPFDEPEFVSSENGHWKEQRKTM